MRTLRRLRYVGNVNRVRCTSRCRHLEEKCSNPLVVVHKWCHAVLADFRAASPHSLVTKSQTPSLWRHIFMYFYVMSHFKTPLPLVTNLWTPSPWVSDVLYGRLLIGAVTRVNGRWKWPMVPWMYTSNGVRVIGIVTEDGASVNNRWLWIREERSVVGDVL